MVRLVALGRARAEIAGRAGVVVALDRACRREARLADRRRPWRKRRRARPECRKSPNARSRLPVGASGSRQAQREALGALGRARPDSAPANVAAGAAEAVADLLDRRSARPARGRDSSASAARRPRAAAPANSVARPPKPNFRIAVILRRSGGARSRHVRPNRRAAASPARWRSGFRRRAGVGEPVQAVGGGEREAQQHRAPRRRRDRARRRLAQDLARRRSRRRSGPPPRA